MDRGVVFSGYKINKSHLFAPFVKKFLMFNLSGRVPFVTDEVSEIDLNTNNLLAKFETKVVLTILIGGKGVALQEITNL